MRSGEHALTIAEAKRIAKELNVKSEEVFAMNIRLSGRVQSEGLKRALTNLDERSRDIITRRWLAEDQEETLQVLADKYGVSAERIRQIEVKAMKQMRKEIEN